MLSAKPWNLEAFIHLLMGILFCVCLAVLAQGAIQHFAGKDKFADGSLLYLVMGSMSLHGSILLGTAVFLKWRVYVKVVGQFVCTAPATWEPFARCASAAGRESLWR